MSSKIKKILVLLVVAIMAITSVGEAFGGVFVHEAYAATASISKKQVSIIAGKSVTLKVNGTKKKISWSTSNKKVAKVNKNGKVTAVKAGKATITAKVDGNKLTCKVTVAAYGLSKKSIKLKEGKTANIKLINAGKKLNWKSSDKKVATVTKTGKITAKSAGKAVISVKYKGKTYKCKVTVKAVKSAEPTPEPQVTPTVTPTPAPTTTPESGKEKGYGATYSDKVKKTSLEHEKTYDVFDATGDNEYMVLIGEDEATKDVAKGDIIVLPDAKGEASFALKVSKVTKEAAGKLAIYGETPQFTEVFDDIDIKENNKPVSLEGFEYNSDIVASAYYAPQASSLAIGGSFEVGDGIVLVLQESELGKYANISGTVTIFPPTIDALIDVDIVNFEAKVNELSLSLTNRVKTEVSFTLSDNASKSFYLGHVNVPIKDGFSVDVIFYLKLSADGSVQIVNDSTVKVGFEYKNEVSSPINTRTIDFDGTKAEVTGSLGVNPQLQLRFLGIWNEKKHEAEWDVEIAKVEAEAGIGCNASVKAYDEAPFRCSDIAIYPYISISVPDDYGLGKTIKLLNRFRSKDKKIELSWELLGNNESNPFRLNWHYEDGSRTYNDKCTRAELIIAETSYAIDHLVGNWYGSYNAPQGKTALTLNILSVSEDGKVSAIFEFYNLPGKSNAKEGSFWAEGTYDFSKKVLKVKGTKWIDKPSNYIMFNIDGTVDFSKGMITGKTASYTGLELTFAGVGAAE